MNAKITLHITGRFLPGMWFVYILKPNNFLIDIEHFHWRHAVLQHGHRIAQTDLDIQGSHTHVIIMRLNHEWRSSRRNRYAQ